MRRRMLILGAIALAIGGFAFFYRGPARPLIRGHLGDVGATMLVYAALGLLSRARIAVLAATTAAIAVALELGQLAASRPRGLAGELVLGASFDPWDLLAYALGIALAAAWDRLNPPAAGRGTP